jgi:hypothetical protein
MSTTEHGWPRLLHNMSARPRTTVTAALRTQGRVLVRFRLEDRALLSHPDSLRPELDEVWREAGLRGAVHVYAFPPAPARKSVKVAEASPLLSINVLGRASAGLLLPGAPLMLDSELLDRELASDDPRLVALAAEGAS